MTPQKKVRRKSDMQLLVQSGKFDWGVCYRIRRLKKYYCRYKYVHHRRKTPGSAPEPKPLQTATRPGQGMGSGTSDMTMLGLTLSWCHSRVCLMPQSLPRQQLCRSPGTDSEARV